MLEGIKKKRGRPLKEGARRKRIFSKCNDEEFSSIERAANISGMSVSEFIRISAYKASIDSINKRQKTLKELYGSADETYYDDEFDYEENLNEDDYV